MRTEIKRLHQKLKTTTVYVTHDQTEAMTLADRIVVLNKGSIQQIGSPLEVYQKPANKFVAGFVGAPAMNFIKYTKNKGNANWQNGSKMSPELAGHCGDGGYELGIRPEHIMASPVPPATDLLLAKCNLEVIEPLGAEALLDFNFHGQTIVVKLPWSQSYKLGKAYYLTVRQSDIHRFAGDDNRRLE